MNFEKILEFKKACDTVRAELRNIINSEDDDFMYLLIVVTEMQLTDEVEKSFLEYLKERFPPDFEKIKKVLENPILEPKNPNGINS